MRFSQRSNQTIPVRTGRNRPARKALSVAEAVEAYLLHHQSSNSQPSTINQHTHCLGSFRDFCTKHAVELLKDVTSEDAQRWLVQLQKEVIPTGKRTPRTISWYFRSLRAFFRWSCFRGFVDVDITAWLDVPKLERPLIRILEPEEFQRLVQACSPENVDNRASGQHHVSRNEAILWVMYDTGIRRNEVCNLKVVDVDRARGTIIVYGKGRKERRIALGKNALQVLGRYLSHWRDSFSSADTSPYVFLTDEGRLTKEGIKMLFRRLRVRAGFDERRTNPHLLRHTFAVRYLMAGGDVFTLQELLGHEDMETIRNYMHLADANVQSQKRKFSPGDQIEMTPKKMGRSGFRKGGAVR